MARNGGLESEPNWQPEESIAKVAINNERQALLFVLIIPRMVCSRGHVGKGNACTAREGTCGHGDTVTRGEAGIRQYI